MFGPEWPAVSVTVIDYSSWLMSIDRPQVLHYSGKFCLFGEMLTYLLIIMLSRAKLWVVNKPGGMYGERLQGKHSQDTYKLVSQ